jgi:hypothetical protein
MHFWNSTPPANEVSLANLNSTLVAFDALVDQSAAASGDVYTSVTAAIAAGHKSIFVRAGGYSTGFTVSAPGTFIFGERRPEIQGSGSSPANGTYFNGPITIGAAAHGTTIANLGVSCQSGDEKGVVVGAADDVVLSGITVAGDSGTNGYHFHFTDWNRLTAIDCISMGSGSAGYAFANATTQHNTGARFIGCRAWYADGPGFSLGTSSDTSTYIKRVTFTGCEANNAGQAWGNGWEIGPKMSGTWDGCLAVQTGSGGHGFYLYNPATTAIVRSFAGCMGISNAGYGFARPASYTGTYAFGGCIAFGNGSGNWANFGAISSLPVNA